MYRLNAEPDAVRRYTRAAVKRRYFAASIDNLLSIVLFFMTARLLGEDAGAIAVVAAAIVYLAYFYLFEQLLSTTPGKFVFGLVVASLGDKRKPGHMALRTFLRLVEANPILLGALPAFLSILLSKSNQRIGDRLANTVVVHKSVTD